MSNLRVGCIYILQGTNIKAQEKIDEILKNMNCGNKFKVKDISNFPFDENRCVLINDQNKEIDYCHRMQSINYFDLPYNQYRFV